MTFRRTAFVIAGIFWLVMMSLLVRRETEFRPEDDLYENILKQGLFDDDVVMDIYWNTKRVGESKTTGTISKQGATIHNETRISLPEAGIEGAKITSVVQTDEKLKLKTLLANASWADNKVAVAGRAQGEQFNIRVTGLGMDREFTIPTPNAMAFASGPLPVMTVNDLEEGMEWEVPLFEPATMKVARGHAVVESRQKILWGGELRDSYMISVKDDVGRRMMTAWSDGQGKVMKLEFSGATLVRRPNEN